MKVLKQALTKYNKISNRDASERWRIGEDNVNNVNNVNRIKLSV